MSVKAEREYVGEIDPRCQFHPHFARSFYANFFVPKKFQSQAVIREKLCKILLYKFLALFFILA